MLALLLNVPKTPEEWVRWSFHHDDSHVRIRQGILVQKGINLTQYQLNPIFQEDVQGWLQRNSQTHSDMNGVLGVQGVDLLDVDFNDASKSEAWTWLHYQEHFTAESALKI